METYVSAIAGLVGALIGASASVLGQMLTEWKITRRNERDVLRAACGEFAAGAFASLQRIELATIESRHIEDLSALGHNVKERLINPTPIGPY
ncbi:MAG TPA: hypothetical protein PL072_04530 [Phycisphaerales bacterium]|nr:hypothetical protein [Phycisphaerales bacterium]